MAIISLLAITSVSALANLPLSRTKQSCNPIGRITQGTSANFRRGEVVCEGDRITAPRNVRLLCFTNAVEVSIDETRMSEINDSLCAIATVPSNPSVRPCDRTGISRLLCLVPKGPEEQFQLIEPDAVSINPRPDISWVEVSAADSYTVRVVGPDLVWERTVDAVMTEMDYPENEEAMREGHAYEVLVVANRHEDSVTASKVVNIQTTGETISLQSRQMEPSRTDAKKHCCSSAQFRPAVKLQPYLAPDPLPRRNDPSGLSYP